MKALVTGGSGFIGSNIVKLLLDNNYEVTVLDNLSSGYQINILPFLDRERIVFLQADVRDAGAVEKACKDKDVVFHLAACVGRQKSLDDPVLDSSTNVLGAVNVLEGMRRNSVPRIVYSSSAAIFGELVTPTIAENHPQNADSPCNLHLLSYGLNAHALFLSDLPNDFSNSILVHQIHRDAPSGLYFVCFVGGCKAARSISLNRFRSAQIKLLPHFFEGCKAQFVYSININRSMAIGFRGSTLCYSPVMSLELS